MKKSLLLLLLLIPLLFLAKKQDSLAIEQTLKRGLTVVYSNPDSAFIYFQQADNLSNDYFFESKTLLHYGIYYDVISKFDSALICYNKALDIARKGNHISIEASALNNLGLIYWNQSNFDEAIEYYNKSIIQFEKIDKKNGIASTKNNIGMIYNEMRNYGKAIEYHFDALDLYRSINDKYGMSACYANLAIVYSNIDLSDSTYFYSQKSMLLKQKINDQWGLATIYTNLAVDFHSNKLYDSSLFYNRKAEKIYSKLKNKNNLASCISGIGRDLYMVGQYEESKKTLEKAEKLALETNNQKTLRNVYDHYSELYFITHEYKKAYLFLKKRMNIGNIIYNTEKEKTINEIQTKYETAKKDKEIAEHKEEILRQELTVKSKNIQLLTIIGILFIVITITVIIVQNLQNKRKKLKLEYEAQEKIKALSHERELAEDKLRISRDLHDNIGSHLTFLITSIDNLSYSEKSEDKKAKMENISNFGRNTMKELRSTIWAMKNEGGPIQELIYKLIDLKTHVSIPIEIQQKNIDSIRLSSLQMLNCYRIIQEAIQNAMKYSQASELTIVIEAKNKELFFEIRDNGIGFEDQSVTKRGLSNMKHRIETLNGQLKIISNNEGTKIKCSFPV